MTVPARLVPLPYAELPGWAEDRHGEAMAAFRLSAAALASDPPKTRALGIDAAALAAIAARARAEAPAGDAAARAFFETWFEPVRVEPVDGGPFLTGYFEPELEGSRVRTDRFRVPLLARPADLVELKDAARPAGFDPALSFARRRPDGGLEPHPDRAAIEEGALAGRGLELCWLESPVDAFFVHVQGSVRVALTDGGTLRLAYDGKAGWPYTSIGKALVERLGVAPETMTADVLKAWLEAHPEDSRALMRQNRSYVFFRVQDGLDPALGAVAAAGAQLTPGRSLAVDRRLHTFHTPVYLDADLPLGAGGARVPFRRLMVAQDTGSAILGPARGDVFVGSGPEAGRRAGLVRHAPRAFVLLRPRPEPAP